MSHRVILAGCLLCLAGAGRLPAADPAAPDPDTLARQGWTITEMVLDKHVEPCARQEMLLGGVRALLRAAEQPVPADLSRRVSAVTTPEQFTALLREVWPPAGKKPEKPADLSAAFVLGLTVAAPGPTRVLPPDVARLSEQIAGNRYVGIGIQIRIHPESKYPQIVDPFRRGAARRAGARPDDLIVAVDGKNTQDVPLRTVVEWLRGEEGTPVTIAVRQPKEQQTRTYHLTRAKVPFDTVFGYRRVSEEGWRHRVDPELPIGYVRVGAINSATLHDLRQLEPTLRAEGVRALVLDLRASGGEGGLEPAELVADGLLDGGVLWRVRDTRGVKEVRADAECLFRGWPLAVLVSGDLFGVGPEAVAAALQDNGRAVLVGEPVLNRVRNHMVVEEPETAWDPGRYVTSRFPLPDGQGVLEIPTARVERASRDHTWPLRPDHVVKLDKKQHEALWEWNRQQERSDPPAGIADKPAPEDPQLAKAVELLRDALRKAGEAPKRTGGDG
jgi:C-terminal peptidase prc